MSNNDRSAAVRLKQIADILGVTPNYFFDLNADEDFKKADIQIDNYIKKLPIHIQKPLITMLKAIETEMRRTN